MMHSSPVNSRREFLRARLDEIHKRVDRAREAADRSDPVQVVVVTKTFPARDVELLADLGVRDVGENRDQEAKVKKLEVRSSDLRWHMIGRLQRNKAASVARWADVVESVDRLALIEPLAHAAGRAERTSALDVLIQVNLDPLDPGGSAGERSGAPSNLVPEIASVVAQYEELRLAGVMAVAPHPDTGVDPSEAFAHLAHVFAEMQAQWPQATTVSAGMSNDLEQAVAWGATQVRIGGAILGQRPLVQ